jgi:hypothetical protein
MGQRFRSERDDFHPEPFGGRLESSMSRIRLRLRSIVGLWLFCQLATFAAAPVLSAAGLDAHLGEAECDCPGTEPGAACPMHKSPARSGRSDTDCVVTSACPPQDAALISLATGLGVLPESATVAEPSAVAPVSSSPVSVLSRFALPDAPPPRA